VIFMPSFIHPLLLWGLPVVAVPVLIHLINMLRHRRVEWAAMEFLLFSQKKHRTWVILKQLLLLLMRMAAVAAVVLIVAQPRLRDRWGGLLGTDRTHHILLVDDSFSMSEHWGDTSAFDQAKAVVQRVGEAAARRQQLQSFTLLRFSRAGQYGGGLQADFTKEPVDAEFGSRLSEKLQSIDVSQTGAEPLPALEGITQLLGEDDGERRVLYIVSDYRARQWDEPADLKARLARLNDGGAEIHMVDCVAPEAEHANLAITRLAPEEGIRGAGVQWRMEVAVRNLGPATARNVAVLLTEDGRARPSVTIAEIPPGKEVKEQFYVSFAAVGEHRIKARLEADAVAADNARYAVVDVPEDMPVLLVDGDAAAGDVRYLDMLLANGPIRTGLRPRTEMPRFLAARPLDEFRTITVANVDRLDQSAVEELQRYVAAGGGVAFFLGERSRAKFINDELYRDGKGLFPLPLSGPAELLLDRLEKAPDLQAEDHFIFRSFAEKRNDYLSPVLVQRYFAPAAGWKPRTDSGVRVIARLRNGAPLVLEKSYGKGRVVAFLTTAGPVWNNWATVGGTFPAMMLDLQVYLSRRPATDLSRQVGTPLELQLDAAQYQPQVRFVSPTEDASPTATVDAVPAAAGRVTATLPQTTSAGFYEARLTKTDGKLDVRYFAVNVDAMEGDLSALGGPDLAQRLLPEVKYQFEPAGSFESKPSEIGGYNLSELLLYLLVLLLVGEQILAWSTSYHPKTATVGDGRISTGRSSRQSLPLPPGEGRGEGRGRETLRSRDGQGEWLGNGLAKSLAGSPHPNPLPEGEGTKRNPLPEGEGKKTGGAA
jgi:hypothetical protein